MLTFTSVVQAGKTPTTTTTGAFTFSYDVGAVAHYHAYGFVC